MKTIKFKNWVKQAKVKKIQKLWHDIYKEERVFYAKLLYESLRIKYENNKI